MTGNVLSLIHICIVLQCLHLNIGIVNTILEFLGMNRVDFMGRVSYFRHIYVWSGVWQTTGFSAIIYIAALGNVDQSLVEASLIDGANRLQRIRIVELPALKPIITIQLIMAIGSIMGVGFDKIYLMQNTLNLPVSEIISTYVFTVSYTHLQRKSGTYAVWGVSFLSKSTVSNPPRMPPTASIPCVSPSSPSVKCSLSTTMTGIPIVSMGDRNRFSPAITMQI